MTASRPRAVLFDLDGTLIDTAPDLARALNRLLVEDGHAALSFATIRPYVSHGSAALIRLGYSLAVGSPAFETCRLRLLELYHADVAVESRLFDGMDAILQRCEDLGLPWGIVTNKPGWLTQPLLRALALDGRAACVIAGDSTSRNKPHPDPLLAAAAALGLASATCLYVGDAERDVSAAHAAGMAAVVALYGYLGPDDDPRAWGADGYIETPAELLAWLPAR